MPFPDDPDDDTGFIPPLPQDDRLWRHPSELAGPDTPVAPPTRRRTARTGVLAAVIVAVLASGLAIVGVITSDSPTTSGTAFAVGPAAEQFSEVALARLAPSIVQIAVDRADEVVIVTGLIVRSDGHVVTASDPLEGARAITVMIADGRAFNATVVGTDPADDLAVVDIEGSGLPTPAFGDPGSLSRGDTIFVIGRTKTERRSWVAAATFQNSGLRLDTADGNSMHDMIGSAIDVEPPTDATVLCNRVGEVIGLVVTRPVSAMRSTSSGSAPSTLGLPRNANAFAHSIEWARRVAEDLIDTGAVHHPWMGVMSTDAPAGGAAVDSVARGGPAESAGLAAGDRIVSADDREIGSSSELVVALRRHDAGDIVRIGYLRDDVRGIATVRLSDRS